eukprot:COSAG04_NODE_1960_length_5128_cov_3.287135_3_plen_390_part_00
MLLALLLHAAPASAPGAAASRLYPHASETREVLDLAGEGWLLASASSDGATTAVPDGWLREPLSLYADALGRRVRQVALPASFDSRGLNATEDMEPRVFQLERTVFVPAAWCAGDPDVVLRVGAVNHDATAFVDGRPLCTHSGEYLPFECQLPTEQLCGANRGRAIRLALVVSNVRTWATLPPGRTVEAAGITRLDQWSGQYSFTGVHGSVHLIARPRRRISDVTTATTLEANGTATLTVGVEHEAEAATVRATLRDARGTSVATAVGSAPELSLNVEHPRLWWPAGKPQRVTQNSRCCQNSRLEAVGNYTLEHRHQSWRLPLLARALPAVRRRVRGCLSAQGRAKDGHGCRPIDPRERREGVPARGARQHRLHNLRPRDAEALRSERR